MVSVYRKGAIEDSEDSQRILDLLSDSVSCLKPFSNLMSCEIYDNAKFIMHNCFYLRPCHMTNSLRRTLVLS